MKAPMSSAYGVCTGSRARATKNSYSCRLRFYPMTSSFAPVKSTSGEVPRLRQRHRHVSRTVGVLYETPNPSHNGKNGSQDALELRQLERVEGGIWEFLMCVP